MSESANGVFKSTFMGGFNKKDVLSFLDSLASQHEQEKNELSENIARLEEMNSSLENELARCKEEISSLNSKLSEEEEKLADADLEITKLNNSLAEADDKNTKLASELSLQAELCEQLKGKINDYEEKVRGYESISQKISETVNRANSDAASIVSEAEKRAGIIVDDARFRAENVTKELSFFRDEISELRSLVKESLFEVEERLDKLDRLALKSSRTIGASSDEAYVKKAVAPSIKKVPQLNTKHSLVDSAFGAFNSLVDKWVKS